MPAAYFKYSNIRRSKLFYIITGDHVNGLAHQLRYKDQFIAVTTLIPNSNRTCSRYDQTHYYINSVSPKRMYDAGENRVTVKPLTTFFPHK